jgi:spore germination cell wall hydrolase CwlJ-like protein
MMGIFSSISEMHKGDDHAAKEFLQQMEIDVLARTLYGEARSEGQSGMEAVAHVILNRVQHTQSKGGQFWWGHDIITVCQMPYQFSCWNPGDPNRKKLMAVDESDIHFATCLRIARRAVSGQLSEDPTLGADHYHTVSVAPYWSRGQIPTVRIGAHVFFTLVR